MKSVIATCSFPGTYDVDTNLALHLEYMREAAAQGVQLLVFPEQSMQGYPRTYSAEEEGQVIDGVNANAETLEGPHVRAVASLAAELGIEVIFGLAEAGVRPGVTYNSAVLVNSSQGVVGAYRKIHVPLQERIFFWPGNEWMVLDTVAGNAGLLICYDKAWPESTRELLLRGADMFIMPTAWWLWDESAGPTDMWFEHYCLFERVRAVENNRWFISSNLAGDIGGRSFFGVSQIINPNGQIVAATPFGEPGLAIAEVDIARGIQDSYHLNSGAHLLRDRRPDTYEVLDGRRPIAIDG